MKGYDKEELKGTTLPQPPKPEISISASTVGSVFISNNFAAPVDAHSTIPSRIPIPFEMSNSGFQGPIGVDSNGPNDRVEVSHVVHIEKEPDNTIVFES